jgi:electron transfer flavoprotein alpha/beta subunit
MKQVPIPSEMRMGADGLMDRTTARYTINHDCTFALETALAIKDRVPSAELFVVSIGPTSFEQSLRKAISMGFDRACLLSDRRLGALVGDYREILPALIERVRAGFTFGLSEPKRELARI